LENPHGKSVHKGASFLDPGLNIVNGKAHEVGIIPFLSVIKEPIVQLSQGDIDPMPGFTMYWWKSALIPLCRADDRPRASKRAETA
jgi:hypothetical protein